MNAGGTYFLEGVLAIDDKFHMKSAPYEGALLCVIISLYHLFVLPFDVPKEE